MNEFERIVIALERIADALDLRSESAMAEQTRASQTEHEAAEVPVSNDTDVSSDFADRELTPQQRSRLNDLLGEHYGQPIPTAADAMDHMRRAGYEGSDDKKEAALLVRVARARQFFRQGLRGRAAVIAAQTQFPEATTSQLALISGASERTVQRYRTTKTAIRATTEGA